ncbi:hypothetical protein CAOG_08511 [Capsaspora owczarzaki ATCC 30864]|uniref:Secreted protein n=1 Tax=Capsaspora owczarzaki (strain ATCC 30864) TaxID=595528 RepID=A0A0D2WJD3_CAPO3|nr:hypothetical protein CAOG_08511 [Capsaspora owczarzaki ATCC 30864]KJE90110.1 hypothetical protein CAOG_008511 [Capsaspora owczarzaki ATCC 30864]|eukprot:XP_011270093.1 hypothetical protein CAOG_08511 [Capsaspora owczarzaki ATCC 30864]
MEIAYFFFFWATSLSQGDPSSSPSTSAFKHPDLLFGPRRRIATGNKRMFAAKMLDLHLDVARPKTLPSAQTSLQVCISHWWWVWHVFCAQHDVTIQIHSNFASITFVQKRWSVH